MASFIIFSENGAKISQSASDQKFDNKSTLKKIQQNHLFAARNFVPGVIVRGIIAVHITPRNADTLMKCGCRYH